MDGYYALSCRMLVVAGAQLSSDVNLRVILPSGAKTRRNSGFRGAAIASNGPRTSGRIARAHSLSRLLVQNRANADRAGLALSINIDLPGEIRDVAEPGHSNGNQRCGGDDGMTGRRRLHRKREVCGRHCRCRRPIERHYRAGAGKICNEGRPGDPGRFEIIRGASSAGFALRSVMIPACN